MDAWYQRGVSEDFLFADSDQHITDYFRQTIHSFQEQNRALFYTGSIELIPLFCKYLFVEQIDDRAELLSGRSESELNAVLGFLPSKRHENSMHRDGDSRKLRKAKEIVWRIDITLPTLPLWNLEWLLSWSESGTDQDIAALEERLTSLFKQIPFTEFVRWFCGRPSPTVENLRWAVFEIRREFCRRLSTGAATRGEVERINKVVSIAAQLTSKILIGE